MHSRVLCAFVFSLSTTSAFAISAKDAAATAQAKFLVSKKTVEIVVSVPEGTKLNYDGPWKLVLDGPVVSKGGATANRSLSEFDKQDRTFRISVPQPESLSAEKALGGFELTYFICDLKVTWCKRGILKGEIRM